MEGSVKFRLLPEADVEAHEAGFGEESFVALSPQPWLAIEPLNAFVPGGFVEITYASSFWDVAVRPVFRFQQRDGAQIDRIAPGPVAGRGIWRGFVPADCVAVSVSPTNRPGRFDFSILSARLFSLSEAARLAFAHDRGKMRAAMLRFVFGKGKAAAALLEQALSSLPLTASKAWHTDRVRPLDLMGLDRPRFDWQQGPWIHLVLANGEAGEPALAATVKALQAQVYPRWTLVLAAQGQGRSWDDGRVRYMLPEKIPDHFAALPATDLVGEIEAGDQWLAHGLACLAEAAMRFPETNLFYGDEETAEGEVLLKPGWSPDFFQSGAFLGHALAARISLLQPFREKEVPDTPLLSMARLASLPAEQVLPLYRILLKRGDAAGVPWAAAPASPAEAQPAESNPSVMIIIPVRDGADRLSRSIASIYENTAFDNYSILVVDDNSVEDDTKQLFKLIAHDQLISVIHNPGGVGLAALCNAAAARRRADVIVFLDNGVEILSEDWLNRLLAVALRPEAGAVGARMQSRSGAILPSAFVLDLHGALAEPNCHNLPADAPEAWLWRAREGHLHEVAGVGGGCLAVARRKFLLIGGFIAEPVLPPRLRDLDLCLRLAARGYHARIEPLIQLYRAELQASSGEAGLAWAAQNWFDILRDDPCFHPGLALREGQLSLE